MESADCEFDFAAALVGIGAVAEGSRIQEEQDASEALALRSQSSRSSKRSVSVGPKLEGIPGPAKRTKGQHQQVQCVFVILI